MKNELLSSKIGYGVSIINIFVLIVFTASFILISIVNPIYIWDGLQGFVAYTQANNQTLKYIAQSSMLLFSVFWVILNTLYSPKITEEKKYLFELSKKFGLLFAGLTAINYFIQISTLRTALNNKAFDGLNNIIMSNPNSMILGINMLGWTLFFGLSNFFFALSLEKNTKPERLLKRFLLIQSLVLILGMFAFIFNVIILTFITMNLFLGLTLFLTSYYLYKNFKTK